MSAQAKPPLTDDADSSDDDDEDFNIEDAREELDLSEEDDEEGDHIDKVADREDASTLSSTSAKRKRTKKGSGSSKKTSKRPRKTKGGDKVKNLRQTVLRVEGEADPAPKPTRQIQDEEDENEQRHESHSILQQEEDARRKQLVDSLWMEMNQPVNRDGKTRTVECLLISIKATNPTKPIVEATKVYQYAGKQFAVSASGTVIQPTQPTAPTTTTPSIPADPNAKPPLPRRQRIDLDAIAAKYGVAAEVQKLTSLEKSKLDWQQFVSKEGIADELKLHNKDGYLEKKAFLDRADERVAENVGNMRRAGNEARR
ncbi:hypothetical protein SmJEL517_g01178 [Synchytrium microbalum]|uniref:SWR1-complex protein 5 n=1 Tax=Synchytrium microbalum TaxID=1806994 RepID=A0A507CBR7_9FUNG|nr:uncharacterized protein SmJEL517_g01178 [Synchytrium microbalum]TPX36599.1 hypothetical protein SmJEL517_g01178 [Synchytrium microbalum]